MTAYRGTWLAVGVLVALLGTCGACATFPSAATGLFVVAGFIGAFMRFVGIEECERYSLQRNGGALLRAAVLVGGCVVAVTGLAALLGASGFLLGLLVIASSPYLGIYWARWPSRRPGAGWWDPVPEALAYAANDWVVAERPALSSLTDERLCAAWITNTRALALTRSTYRTRRLVEARAALLGEMERRNAAGVSAWPMAPADTAQDSLPFISQRDVPEPGLGWDRSFPGFDR